MPEETVEAAASEDNGNVPVGEIAPAPSPTPTPATPAKEEPAAPAEPVVELFDLPDGRKVDAATLASEWKNNFMPDYTRKSQELAKANKPPEALPVTPQKPYESPDWQPSTYAELIEIAKQEVKSDLERTERETQEHAAAIETAVITQLNEVKAVDPTVNENALFLHANKYGFRDLKLAHQNMQDMSGLVKKVQTDTVKNIQKRSDPVSVNPGASGGAKQSPSSFANATEYLRSLKQ